MKLRSALAGAKDLAQRWPNRMAIAPETGLPVCIQTTRLAYEAFRLAGFLDVAPMACELVALNNQARRSIEERTELKGACQIEVGPDAPDTDSLGGWKGHLILEHPRFLLDLTFAGVVAALKAPGFGVVNAFCAEKHEEVELIGGVWTARTDTGNIIMYRPRPELGGWQTSTAWLDFTDIDEQGATKLAAIITKASA